MSLQPYQSAGTANMLRDFIAEDIAKPVAPVIPALVSHIRARADNPDGVQAILLYGSGLWQGAAPDRVWDLHVLVDRFRSFDKSLFTAAAGRMLPPNVFYTAIEDGGNVVRCKFNVMTAAQFRKGAEGRSPTPQVWARFAQPCRLVYVRDESARDETALSLTKAVMTFHDRTLPLLQPGRAVTVQEFWETGLAYTYASELRSERQDRVRVLFESAPDNFNRRAGLALSRIEPKPIMNEDGTIISPCALPAHRRAVRLRRIARPFQKLIAFLRLLKAALTFENGVDYALWKIERHSGIRVEATEFQRRHPLIGGWPLLWRLYRAGAFK